LFRIAGAWIMRARITNAAWRRWLLLLLVALWATSASPAVAEDLLDPAVEMAQVVTDCQFTEGPALGPDGLVYFSDGPNDRILRIEADGSVALFRQPCGRTNGMDFDRDGRLVMCQSAGEGGGRRVARLEQDGTETLLAESHQGRRLNAPNDLAIDGQGRIWFTDIASPPEGQQAELPSGVYRIDAAGEVARVVDDLLRPNGIAITPDGRTLYVSDRGTQRLHRYRVRDDAGLEPDGVVYDFSPDRGIDGLCLDAEGNIWAAAGQDETTGLWVVSPEGKLLLHRPMPEFSTNLCFAGADLKDLYFTATTSVYRLRTTVAGAPVAGTLRVP
jgi:gluconolactonase